METAQNINSSRLKRFLLGVLAGLVFVGFLGMLFYFVGKREESTLSKRGSKTFEIPKGFDVKNFDNEKKKELLKKISEEYPSEKIGEGENAPKIIQDIVLTEERRPIPLGGIVMPTPDVSATEKPAVSPTAGVKPTPPPSGQAEPPVVTPTPKADEPVWPTPGPDDIDWDENHIPPQLIFTGEGDGTEITDMQNKVNKYYDAVVGILGPAYSKMGRRITFYYDPDSETAGYFPQTDMVVLTSTDPFEIVPGIAAAFFWNYYTVMPETWKYGTIYGVTYLVSKQFPGDFNPMSVAYIEMFAGDYEKSNVSDYPIWGAAVYYGADIIALDYRVFMAMASMLKPYQYDAKFFAKLKDKITERSYEGADWSDDVVIFADVATAFPSVEGLGASLWYSKQQVLHQLQTNPIVVLLWRLIGQTYVVGHNSILGFKFKTDVTNNVISFAAKKNKQIKLKVENDQGQMVGTKDLTTDENGMVNASYSDLAVNTDGRYVVKDENSSALAHFLYAGVLHLDKLRGVVLHFGNGKIAAKDGSGNLIEEVNVTNGAFQFTKSIEGVVYIQTTDGAGNLSNIQERAIGTTGYFAIIDPLAYTGQPVNRSPKKPEPEGCAASWQEYKNEKFGLSFKYPSGWKENVPGHYTFENEKMVRRSLVSDDDPIKLANPKEKISNIEVIASLLDLKTDEDYGRWFEDGSGRQQVSKVSFGGVEAERFFNDTDMPAGPYKDEMFYFKKGDVYYLVSFGYYTEGGEESGVLWKCFGENFKISGVDALTKCPAELLSSKEEILAQADWQNYKDPCVSVPEDKICGYIRSVYDNGKDETGSEEKKNTCVYCKFFDKDGFRELRGTKMYALGYKKGGCK